RAPERDGRDRGSYRGGRRPRSEGRSDGRSGDEARLPVAPSTAVAAAAEPPPVRRKAPARPADAPAFGAGLIHEPKDEPTPEVAAPVEEQTAEHIEAAPDLIAEAAPDTIEPPPEPEAREPEPKTDTTGFGAGIV
ncbi:MAG: hypothetical protein O7B99_09280, partial [Planctomycetota bacterium]|nr:hypothetical protein [Planctomycetota bacterium]